jgi:hypothetical protein
MRYADRLLWAADQHSRLTDRKKLRRIQTSCGYDIGWIDNVINRDWRQVLADARKYREDEAARARAAALDSDDPPPWEA